MIEGKSRTSKADLNNAILAPVTLPTGGIR